MRKNALSTIATISGGQGAPKQNEFSDSGIPFVRAGSLEDLLSGKNEADLELVPAETARKRKLKLYPKGSILFAKSGMSATKDRIYVLQNPAYVVSHLAILLPKDNVYTEYLRLALKQFPPSVLIKDPAYPAISLGDIQDYQIPVPEELDDQVRIAHLLGKVEGLIAQRKQHLQQLDDLLKSVFLEMFGNLFLNEKNYDMFSLDQIKATGKGTFSNGPFGSDLLTSELSESGEVPVIYIRDVRNGYFKWVSNVFVTKEKASSLPNCTATIGDILVAKVGDPPGIAAINFQFSEAVITQDVIRLRIDNSIANPYFVQNLLNSNYGKWLIKRISIKGTRSRFPLRAFKELHVPIPRIGLQNQFAAIVEKVEAIKSRYQQSLAELEKLYGALSQKAFKGELDLSRVPSPEQKPEEAAQETKVPEAPDESEFAEMINGFSKLDMTAMSSAEGRAQILKQWFGEWLNDTTAAKEFSPDHFWQRARQSTLDYQGEDDAGLDYSLQDYDLFKQWLFDAIAEGRIEQTRNAIEMNEKIESGNQIILKKVR